LKQAIGLALIALSYFIIAYNVKDLGNSGLLAIKWLILLSDPNNVVNFVYLQSDYLWLVN
jgi:hypothetical protein